jgi:NADH-quinone oxidoreductase subunit N
MINSAISAFYYLAVVVQMYFRSAPEGAETIPLNLNGPITVTLAVAAIVTIVLGVWPTPLVNLNSLGLFG